MWSRVVGHLEQYLEAYHLLSILASYWSPWHQPLRPLYTTVTCERRKYEAHETFDILAKPPDAAQNCMKGMRTIFKTSADLGAGINQSCSDFHPCLAEMIVLETILRFLRRRDLVVTQRLDSSIILVPCCWIVSKKSLVWVVTVNPGPLWGRSDTPYLCIVAWFLQWLGKGGRRNTWQAQKNESLSIWGH